MYGNARRGHGVVPGPGGFVKIFAADPWNIMKQTIDNLKAIRKRAKQLHKELHKLELSGAIGNADTDDHLRGDKEGATLDKLHSFLHYLLDQ
jgi:hypothetical protein